MVFLLESTNSQLFPHLDQSALERVTVVLGMAFAAEAAATLPRFAEDVMIDPDVFAAGIVQAHALGLVSALVAAERNGGSSLDTAAVLGRLAAFLGDEARAARGGGIR